jgi:exosortase B
MASRWSSRLGFRGWWPIIVALAVLYVPMYADMYQIFWRSDHDAAGAVILVVVVWLIAHERELFRTVDAGEGDRRRGLGAGLLAVGLVCYVLGRSQVIYQLQALSQIPVLFGLAYLLLRTRDLRRLWFPFLLLLFLVPIPGSVMDEVLLPLKQWVSQFVTWLLYCAGYPIARNGVVLTIGNYELLIADACSGLNSMVALSGIGLLYVYLAGHRSRWWSAALLISVLPIAFAANVVRVLSLVLVTYYAGDRAGRSFHSNAGYLEILAAFVCFFGFDRLLLHVSSASRAQAA